MTKTVTFHDVNKKAKFTCKEELLESCATPEKYTILELNRDYNMLSFLHNEQGPAITRGDLEEFWIDGRCISVENPELAARIKSQGKFNDKFEQFVTEDGSVA